ncbi:MAG: hypothetical protein ACM3JK_02660 [Betaproteobacteria bacterium]
MSALDIILGIISCLLTIMVLSYLVGDNPMFRIAISIFVGVSAGYVGAVALYQVLIPKVLLPLINDPMKNFPVLLIPILLSLLLLAKIFPRIGWLGGVSMAFMVGVSTAVAIAGALIGTLVPQFLASIAPFGLKAGSGIGSVLENLSEGVVMLLGTVTTLAYFHFGVKSSGAGAGSPNPIMKYMGMIGQFFIAVTFGVLFTGAYAAAVAALVGRLYFIWNFIMSFFS